MNYPRLLLALTAWLALGAAPGKPPELDLFVDPAPAASRISVVAKVRGLKCTGATTRVWLNRGLTVEQARVDGRDVLPVLDPFSARRAHPPIQGETHTRQDRWIGVNPSLE